MGQWCKGSKAEGRTELDALLKVGHVVADDQYARRAGHLWRPDDGHAHRAHLAVGPSETQLDAAVPMLLKNQAQLGLVEAMLKEEAFLVRA